MTLTRPTLLATTLARNFTNKPLHISSNAMSTNTASFDAPPAGNWSKPFNPSPSVLGVFNAPSSSESTNEVGRILAHNHKTYHAFFNESGFHNHMPHALLAGYGAQASPQQLIDIFGFANYLDKSFRLNNKAKYGTKPDGPLDPLTESDWNNKLGKAEHYWRYLAFFDKQLETDGIADVLLKYVFDEKLQDKPYHMMARFMGGVVHPLIHTGNGVEFNIPGCVAEGLAMTCMTSSKYAFLYPSDWLSHSYYNDKNKRSLSTGEMIAKLLKDEKLDRDSLGLSRFQPTLESDPLVKSGAAEHLLQEYVYAWDKTRGPSPDIPGAMEDLAWLTTLLVGAVAKFEKRWRHDFFLAHALTSYLYLASILEALPPHNETSSSDKLSPRVALLQAYLRMILLIWVLRGRPDFHITDQLMSESVDVGQSEGPQWPELLEVIRTHEDEHVAKALRSLYYLDRRYGDRKGNILTGYDDAAHLDGTAFLRTARQLVRQFGAQQPPQSEMDDMYGWDFSGFFSDVPENAPKNRL